MTRIVVSGGAEQIKVEVHPSDRTAPGSVGGMVLLDKNLTQLEIEGGLEAVVRSLGVAGRVSFVAVSGQEIMCRYIPKLLD